MAARLYHASDGPGVERFDPRPSSGAMGVLGEVVWAVDEEHLQNYLLPRECPRVAFYAGPGSTPDDVARLMGQSAARFVVAVESRWLPEIRRQRLYVYELPSATFTLADAGAGYYVSREPVVPLGVMVVEDLLEALIARDVELRVMPSLWKLRDAVVASTLQFSCIRMRNAQPRP